jgi:hypothetical protein
MEFPKLSIPPIAVQDTAAKPVRYGDGFIQAGLPPMAKKTEPARG